MAGAGFGSREASAASQCLVSNCYTFEILDSFGDGISGQNGNGSFDVTVDGELILDGGNVTFSSSASFGGDCVPLSTDPKPDVPPLAVVTLVLLTDRFPGETFVSLEELSTGETFWTLETFPESNAEYTLTQEIDPTGCYSFVITDVSADGICCSFGNGTFELFYDSESVFSGSDFGASASFLVGEECEDQI